LSASGGSHPRRDRARGRAGRCDRSAAARRGGLIAALSRLATLCAGQRLIAAALAVEALGLRPGEDVGLEAVDAHAALRRINPDHLHGALRAPVAVLPSRADRRVLFGCWEHLPKIPEFGDGGRNGSLLKASPLLPRCLRGRAG